MYSKKALLSIILLMFTFSVFSHEGDHAVSNERFLENKGQWHENIRYKTAINGGYLYFEDEGFSYQFYKLTNIHPKDPSKPSNIKGHNFRMNFLGANPSPQLRNGKASYTDFNFYYGNEPEKWVSGAKAFSTVTYKDLYKNIDMKIYDKDGFIKYDFIVASGADPSQIKMHYEGMNSIHISDGDLVVEHDLGRIKEEKPSAFQEINGKLIEIACEFHLSNNTVEFKFPEGYNSKYPLVIDPTLYFSTFSGSKSDNWGMTATYDEFGNAYNGGTVFGPEYLTPTGGYDTTFNNAVQWLRTDVAIRKYSSDGSQIHYSTYLGGNASELVHSMIVNDKNELIVFGVTSSTNFPVVNAYDSVFNGGSPIEALAIFSNGTDIYSCKFSPDGHSLLGSTYIGGSENDGLNYENLLGTEVDYQHIIYNYGDQARGEVELDKYGNIYIASQTHSADFPKVNSLDSVLNGVQDAVLLKLSPDLSKLLYSTYIGGSNTESGVSVKIDSSNNIFLAGGTTSSDFHTTAGAYSENYNGGMSDGYIIKLDSSGANYLASTFIGANDYDQVFNLDVDRFGNPYFFAQSRGGNFPIINAKYSVQNGAQLVGKLSINLDSMFFSTKIGNLTNGGEGDGVIEITPTAFMVDRCQNLYISGWGGILINDEMPKKALGNMPITPDAFKSTTHGMNFYIAVIKRNADALLFATYFGGTSGSEEHVDGGTSRFDERGVVYQSVCAGCGGTDNFITKDALYPNNGANNCNNAIFKFDLEILPKAQFSASRDTGCAPLTVRFDDESLRANQFFWDFGKNDTTSTVRNPVRTFNEPGVYLVKLGVTDSICQSTDTAYKYIVVYPELDNYLVSNDTVVCQMDTLEISINSRGTATTFHWSSNRNFSDTLNAPKDSVVMVLPKTGNNAYFYVKAGNSIQNCTIFDSVWVKHMDYNPGFTSPFDSICSPASIVWEGQNTGATFYGFELSDGSTYPMNNVLNKTFTEPGTYEGFYRTENSFCNLSDTFHFKIEILPGITVDVPGDTTICYSDSIEVKGNAYGKAAEFLWSTSPNFSSVFNNPKDSSVKISTSQAKDTLYFMARNSFCADSTVFNLEMEHVLLDIDATMILCVGDTAQLEVVDMSNTSPIDYEWKPSNEVISGQYTAQIYTSPLVDTEFELIGTSSAGCSDTALHFLEVNEPNYDIAQILASLDTIFRGQTTILSTDLDDPNLTFEWSPIDHLSDPTSESTSASPVETTDFTVEVYDKSTGCTITALKRIVVNEVNCGEPEIFIPTAFTPNGDQNNDVFAIEGDVIEEINLSIYNRWGQKIFESFEKQNGWNGKYQGMAVDPGVFVYHLHLKCFDGQDFFKKGNITLIR